MSVISMKQLLEAGVHFGHQTRRCPAAYALAGCVLAGTMAAFVPQFLGTLVQGIGSGALFLVMVPALDGVKLKEHIGA